MNKSERERKNQNLEKTFPSVGLIYPIAIASYDNAVKRYDAVESRIQSVIISILQTTAFIFTIGISLKKDPASILLALGAIFGFVSICTGLYSKAIGEIYTLTSKDSETLKTQLKLSELEFKNQVIKHSHKHFTQNNNLISEKQNLMIGMLAFFTLEIMCLVFWLLLSPKVN
jgi:hypothetical protein